MRILFIGDHDICRGPMATVFLRSHLPNGAIEVRSAGIQAEPGQAFHQLAKAALAERGIQFDHTATSINPALLTWANLILTMTRSQKFNLIHRVPMVADKLYTFQTYIGNAMQDIIEPVGDELAPFQACADIIAEACYTLYQEILEES